MYTCRAAIADAVTLVTTVAATAAGGALVSAGTVLAVVAPERVERAKLDGLLGRDTVHQGMALLAVVETGMASPAQIGIF